MDEDVSMQDREESEYPTPTDDERTPYPIVTPQTSPVLMAPSPPSSRSASKRGRGGKVTKSARGAKSAGARGSRQSSFGALPALAGQSVSAEDGVGQTAGEGSATATNGHPITNGYFTQADNTEETDNPDASTTTRGKGRGRGRASKTGSERPAGRRGRGWRWALRGTDHADLFSKPKQPRGPTGKKRGRKPGRPKFSVNATGQDWIDPGARFRELQGEANKAWLDGDNDKALEYAKMAVQVNSEVFMAHKMIHDILESQGDERGAVVALGVGANTKRDADLWAEVADRILALEDRAPGDEEWAKNCYVESLKIDRDCYKARAGKLKLAEENLDWDSARLECKAIARRFPEDLDHVYKYAELCIAVPNSYEWERARDAYEAAFKCYAEEDMLGHNAEEQWTHLNMYLDVVLKLGMHTKGISELKRLARWFLGRKNEVFWDESPDDREFDDTHERRMHVWQFQQGHASRDNSQYGDGLPLELRIKLGLLRAKTGMYDEALRHFEHLKLVEGEADSYEDMIMEVAECMKSRLMFGKALEFLEPLKRLGRSTSKKFYMSIAQCFNGVGRHQEAESCYMTVIQMDKHDIDARVQLARLYNSTGDPAKAFRMAEEVTVMGRTPRPQATQAPQVQAPQPPPRRLPMLLPKPDGSGVPPPIRSTISANGQFEHLYTNFEPYPMPKPPSQVVRPPSQGVGNRVHGVFEGERPVTAGSQRPRTASSTAQSNGPAQDGSPVEQAANPFIAYRTKGERVLEHFAALRKFSAGDDEESLRQWAHHASKFEDEFRRTNKLYAPVDSLNGGGVAMSYLPQTLVKEMQAIKKKTGLSTELDDDGDGTATIDMSTFKNFHSISFADCHRIFSELALWYAKNVEQVKCYDTLRNALMKPHVFRLDQELWNTTQAVRMCCALMFNDSKLLFEVAQGYLSRGNRRSGTAVQLFAAIGRLSAGDSCFYDAKITSWVSKIIDTQDSKAEAQPNGTDGNAVEIDPGLLAIRGYQAANLQHFNARPALPYLLRALVQQPENLAINLSLAMTYISNAMRKGAMDKLKDLARGRAFFDHYYELRIASGKASHLQEAEYNRARLQHQLGYIDIAVSAYKTVLELSSEVQKECVNGDGEVGVEDFAKESAFALQRIFVAAGDEAAARAITEEWLVL